MSGGFDFFKVSIIYIYIYYIFILYTHPKFCISHRQKILRFALFFDCKLYILGELDGGGKRIKKDDSQMSEKREDGDKPNEMFLDPKVSAAV